MKSLNKIFLLLVLSLSIVAKVEAQETMYIYKDGAVVGEHALAEVDSVIFYKAEVPNENTVTDIDGNVYNTVVIGTQTWMAENLSTTSYNDGTAIQNVPDGNEWSSLTTGAYCWYNNEEVAYKEPYGALYNYYAIETTKLCPLGWHVPTDDEWSNLAEFLEGNSVAGGKLKELSNIHWETPNTGASNEFNFTALPGGFRGEEGSFFNINYLGRWWSSTKENDVAITLDISWNSIKIDYFHAFLKYGGSVRCIKDSDK